MTIPKECINNNCKNIIFVPHYQIHLPLQCSRCIEKKNETVNIQISSLTNDRHRHE